MFQRVCVKIVLYLLLFSVIIPSLNVKMTCILPDQESEKCSENDILDTEKSVSEQPIHERCRIKECRICTASLAYIAGFYSYALQKRFKCQECKEALLDSEEDQCTDKSLIMLKNFKDDALHVPSGSLCKLIVLNEQVLRQNITLVTSNTRDLEDKLLIHVLQQVNDVEIFPHLSLFHSLVTSNGADNHYTTLIQLVSRKYMRLGIKNILKDHAREKAFGKPCGNDLHRRRMLYHD